MQYFLLAWRVSQSGIISIVLLRDCYLCMLYCTAIAVVQLHDSAEFAGELILCCSLQLRWQVVVSSGLLQREVTEINYRFLKLKLNLSYYRCVLLLYIFMVVWWDFICKESICWSIHLAALLRLVMLLLSRQPSAACSWVCSLDLSRHRAGSLLCVSRVAGFLLISPVSDTFLVNWDSMAKTVSNSRFLRQLLQFSFPLYVLIWDNVTTARKHRFDILQIHTHLLYSEDTGKPLPVCISAA